MPRAALPFPRQAPDALPRGAGPPQQLLAEHPPPSPRRPVGSAPAPREFVVLATAQPAPLSGGGGGGGCWGAWWRGRRPFCGGGSRDSRRFVGETGLFQCGLQPTGNGRFNRRRGALDVLAHFLELLKGNFSVNTEFRRDLVYTWFGSHTSPVPGPPVTGGPLVTGGSHFEPLMTCPLAVQPVLYIAGV